MNARDHRRRLASTTYPSQGGSGRISNMSNAYLPLFNTRPRTSSPLARHVMNIDDDTKPMSPSRGAASTPVPQQTLGPYPAATITTDRATPTKLGEEQQTSTLRIAHSVPAHPRLSTLSWTPSQLTPTTIHPQPSNLLHLLKAEWQLARQASQAMTPASSPADAVNSAPLSAKSNEPGSSFPTPIHHNDAQSGEIATSIALPIRKRAMDQQGGQERYGGDLSYLSDGTAKEDVPRRASAEQMARRKIAPRSGRRNEGHGSLKAFVKSRSGNGRADSS